MKTSRSYKEGIAILEVQGIPDSSLGHNPETIGILLSWKLTLIGLTVLEGKKEHLVDLLYVILSYSRCCISGLTHSISDQSNSIRISAVKEGHELMLRSSKMDIEPLSIVLDDAELLDLTRCLDMILLDSCVAIGWILPISSPFLSNKFSIKPIHIRKLINPLVGISCFCLTAFTFLNLPVPQTGPQTVEGLIDKNSYSSDINK